MRTALFGTNTFKRPYFKWPVESFGRRKGGQRPQRKEKKMNATQREIDKLNNELLKYKDRSDYLNIVEEMNQAIVKGFAEGYRVSEEYSFRF